MEFTTILWISLLLILLKVLYSYLKQTYSYWEERGVPFVPGYPFVGSAGLNLLKDNIHEVHRNWYKKHGKLYGTYEGFRPVLNVADPDLLREIMVKAFHIFPGARDFGIEDSVGGKMVFFVHGETWKRIRTILTPALSSGKIKKMFSIIFDSVSTLSRNMSKAAESGKPTDVKRLSGAFSMDVIASCAFGTKIDSFNNPDNDFVVSARRIFSGQEAYRFLLLSLFPILGRLFHLSAFNNESMHFFQEVVLKVIEERKKTKDKKYYDLLQLMVDAAEQASKTKEIEEKNTLEEEHIIKDMGHEEGNEKIFSMESIKNKGLSNEEMIANCIMFFLVGYDTTSSTITFALYLLALNPDCQEKLIAEVDESIRQNQNQLTYDSVQNMKYLDMVFSETLRMFPIAFNTERAASEDYRLGDTGILIEKGTIVNIPIYAIQRDPKNYVEPDRFDPMRFSSEEKARRDGLTYLPFGAGPRNCVGMRFAIIEAKLCLAYIISQFRFKKCPEMKVPLNFLTAQGLLNAREVLLKIEERHDKVFHP